MKENLLVITGIISAIVLVSSLTAGLLLGEEEISFSIEDDIIMNDVENITSFGPRVTGSSEESDAANYIKNRFTDIGLDNVQIEEYQVTGAWFVDADPEEHQILMHAQLEQGAQNIPGAPDGAGGVARVQLDSTGSLNHIEKFTYLGYSGSNHKHDNIITFLGNGSSENFISAGDLTDLAVMINYDNQRNLSDIYKDSIDQNAGVVMIYTEGVEVPPFRTVTVQENGETVPFPDAYGGEYADLLIPFIYISESVAITFHEYIEQAEEDPTLFPSLDGFWEGNNVGTRTVRVVTGELTGNSDKKIMIGAHHDSAYISPGAVDNAVGVAQLLEIATQLSYLELDTTIKFATWGGEELGLLGSQAYINANLEESQNLDLYINLDSTNLNPNKGLGTLGIESSELEMVEPIIKISSEVLDGGWDGYSTTVNHIKNGGNSDHRSFNNKGIKTLGFFGWEYEEYHTQDDVAGIVHEESLGLTVEIILEIILLKNGHDENKPIIQIQGLEGESSSWVFPFVLALMAGLATGIGGLIVFILKEITAELMSFMLAMAAGVMLLVSIVDLWLGRALEFGFMSISLSFTLGILVVYAVSYYANRDIENINLSNEKKLYKSGILTAIALAIHNFPEGLAMGVAVLESAQYGVVLMAAIALHNIPEGIAVAAPIQAGNGGRLKATLIAMVTGLTEPLGALFALLILGSILTPIMVGCSLAFVGGIMTVVAYKELIPQALQQNRPQHMIVGGLFGAAIMQLSLFLLG
tara:strand:- start:4109 stop:6367 length:2259 start_codon:yes stop_codon:yes gene_type:complete